VNGARLSAPWRAVAPLPTAAFAFASVLALTAMAVGCGLVGEDTMRLWAAASAAADGQLSIGRIVAGYPTVPFLVTTAAAWLAPAGAPVPSLVAAALLAFITGFCFVSFRRIGFHGVAAGIAAVLVALHPALLRAAVAGPADMFLALFLLLFCLALFDLRARSGTSEVMHAGLALMALAFSHPAGAAFTLAALPFLALAVRPALVANSALNVVIALIFPSLFMLVAFAYVSWIFPGDGWTFFAAPSQSLSLWTAAATRTFGNGLSGVTAIDCCLAMGAALALGAPLAVMALMLLYRRRPLTMPIAAFLATTIVAAAICVASTYFGDPSAIVVAAPALAGAVVMRVPIARERIAAVIAVLLLGWLGGFLSLALIDPATVDRLYYRDDPGARERLDTIAVGGASAGRDGVLADFDNAPALVLGRGGVHGIFGPASEPFALATLFMRVDTPLVAVPDPQSTIGAGDRLDAAFPDLFRNGSPGYRLIYQNDTWRLFAKEKQLTVSSR
jgi:membrane protein XagC